MCTVISCGQKDMPCALTSNFFQLTRQTMDGVLHIPIVCRIGIKHDNGLEVERFPRKCAELVNQRKTVLATRPASDSVKSDRPVAKASSRRSFDA